MGSIPKTTYDPLNQPGVIPESRLEQAMSNDRCDPKPKTRDWTDSTADRALAMNIAKSEFDPQHTICLSPSTTKTNYRALLGVDQKLTLKCGCKTKTK